MKAISVLMIIALLGACAQTPIEGPTTITPSGQSDLAYFESNQELLSYLQDNQGSGNYYSTRSFGVGAMAMDMAVAESAPTAVPAANTKMDGDSGADDFSTTNVQVEGVDEADIVKNDGKYLYVLAGETLVIMDAYPAQDAEILSETHVRGRPTNLFLDDDTLVVFSQDNEQRVHWPEYSLLPEPRYTQITKAYIYDITDREDPELLDTIEMTGSYVQSRMMNGYVYTITTEYPYYTDDIVYVPEVRSASTVIKPRIYHFDNPEDNYQYTTVTTFKTDGDNMNAETYLTGYANTVYMSTNALYIAYQKNMPWRTEQRDQFKEVILPVLPSELRDELAGEEWDVMAQELEDYFNGLDEDELEELYEDIYDAVEEYETKRAQERSRSVIHKIAVDDGQLDHEAQGEIPGTLLNQFSLDENDGNLRVATTTNVWTSRNSIRYNNVYVLDEDLDVIGELEEIAKDERIYSTRFIGDRLYMVTFRQTDPFFVIELSDPRDPEVLGELKIPGWSSYLHPYDEDHIIGIGKQTKENEWGGVTTLGVKISLFDVSDVSNPKEVDTYEIGTSGSDSEVLNDHKAFLFDKEKELLVLPVREVKEQPNYDRGYYRQRVWQGAYVFQIDDSGFDFRDKIAHYDGDRENYWSWWGSTSSVRRALYMDDVLYTVSLEKVRMHSLDDLDSIKSIELPYEQPGYGYPEPYFMDDMMVRGEAAEVDAMPVAEMPMVK